MPSCTSSARFSLIFQSIKYSAGPVIRPPGAVVLLSSTHYISIKIETESAISVVVYIYWWHLFACFPIYKYDYVNNLVYL